MRESRTLTENSNELLPNDPMALDRLMRKEAEELTDAECDAIVTEIRKHRAQLESKKRSGGPKKTYRPKTEADNITLADLDLGDIEIP